MQRYVAACCAVFMHKQARLSIPRWEHVCIAVSLKAAGAPGLGSTAAAAPWDAAALSGCSRQPLLPFSLGSQPLSLCGAFKASPTASLGRKTRGDTDVTHWGVGAGVVPPLWWDNSGVSRGPGESICLGHCGQCRMGQNSHFTP